MTKKEKITVALVKLVLHIKVKVTYRVNILKNYIVILKSQNLGWFLFDYSAVN